MNENEIKEYVQSVYDKIVSKMDSNRVLGLFVQGRANYGFAQNKKDINLYMCYLPTFEELCTEYPNRYYFYVDNDMVGHTDARCLYQLATDQDLVVMESVFSEYSIINPRYKDIYNKYITLNKEIIFHYDEYNRIKNAIDRAKDILKYGINCSKDEFFEVCRIIIACELYLQGVSVENCINLKKDYHIKYLQSILDETFVPDKDKLYEQLDELLEQAKDTTEENTEVKNIIKKCAVELIGAGLRESQDEKVFRKELTETERKAFDIFINNLHNGEGNISISQLLESTTVSRPVFKNVLQKMKDKNFAEITNMGAKGTYIKILK